MTFVIANLMSTGYKIRGKDDMTYNLLGMFSYLCDMCGHPRGGDDHFTIDHRPALLDPKVCCHTYGKW